MYAGIFRLHWFACREEPAARFGGEALAMADELGLKEIRAQILSGTGALAAAKGDPGGFEAMEESIRLFEELNSSDAQRPYNNVADSHYNHGRLAEAQEATRRMQEAERRFGSLDWRRWNDGQAIRLDYMAGRWDSVLATAETWLADARERDGHYLEALWLCMRGRIRFARGDVQGALADGADSLAAARAAGDAQMLVPAAAFGSRLLWQREEEGAEALALELVELCRGASLNIANDSFPEVAPVFAGLGLRAELEELAAAMPTPTPWRDGGLALGTGDPLAAAATFGAIGARPYEADSLLLAARAGLDADLSVAIDFFREVDASAYLAEAESLAATSRSA